MGRRDGWHEIFLFPQGSVARRLSLFLLLLAAYSAGVALLDHELLHDHLNLPSAMVAMQTLLGTALGLLLVFRTNTSYERWWEGRKLWGQLVNDSRNLAIKVVSLRGVGPDEVRHCGRLLINFARALKEHLRDGVKPSQLSLYGSVPASPEIAHVPAHIALLLRQQIARWRQEALIDGYEELLLDPHSRSLMDVCGACERIRKTPLTPSYRIFVRRVVVLYLLSIPWALADQLGYWTALAVAVLGYFMLGLELIAEDIQDPFGRGEDDLLLDEICHGIENSIREIVNDGSKGMTNV